MNIIFNFYDKKIFLPNCKDFEIDKENHLLIFYNDKRNVKYPLFNLFWYSDEEFDKEKFYNDLFDELVELVISCKEEIFDVDNILHKYDKID